MFPMQPLIPFVSISARWSGDMARRLSLAELPDPAAAIAVRPEPAASSSIPLRIVHLVIAIRAETIAAAEPNTLQRNNRHDNIRRLRRIDTDLVSPDARMLHRALGPSQIRVDVEMREVAAKNVEAQPVARGEQIARRVELDRDHSSPAWHPEVALDNDSPGNRRGHPVPARWGDSHT